VNYYELSRKTMLKRYIQTGFFLFLLALLYGLGLLPVLLVRASLQTGQYLLALLSWAALVGLSLPFLLGIIIRRVWFFPGRGEPVLQDLLREKILAINDMEAPVRVKEKRHRLIVCWRHDDPAWCERMDRAGMKKTFELHLELDNATKTVTMTDRARKVDFDLCPVKVKTGFLALPRPCFRVATGPDWSVEAYRDRRDSEYRFQPWEIKSPVMGTILAGGWNVRFSLF